MKKNPMKRIARALLDALASLAPTPPAAHLTNNSNYEIYVTNGTAMPAEVLEKFAIRRINNGEKLDRSFTPEETQKYFTQVTSITASHNNNNNFSEDESSSEDESNSEDKSSKNNRKNKP